MKPRRLARSAGVIGGATLASRVLGMVRDVIQGVYFATSNAADAFGVATRIPSLLRDLFAEGAMSAAFVPTMSRIHQTEGREAAWRLGSQVINALILVTGTVVVAGVLFAEPLVELYAPGFERQAGKTTLTISLTRINMPFLLLVAVAAACMGMLNSVRRFVIPAASPALFNVVFILCTVVLVPMFTRIGIEPVMALSVAMLLGGVVQIAAQWPALRKEGYRHRWQLNPSDPNLRTVLVLMGPGTLGVAAAQINLLVNTSLATNEPGAVSALGYAFRLIYMPIGIFGVSIATAAIPDLARQAAAHAYHEMRDVLSFGVRLMLMLSVPASVGLMVLAVPIVELIFEHGAFGPSDTQKVATALLFYAPAIAGYSIVKIAGPSFYSLQDSRTPVIVSLITIGSNLVLNLWLNSVLGFRGLALGTAIAANINAGLLLVLLGRRIGGVDGSRIALSFAKIVVASALMGLAGYVSEQWLRDALPGGAVMIRLIRVTSAIGISLATLALAAWVLRIQEFRAAVARVFSLASSRKPQPPGPAGPEP
jgi:putative peptidoglycan lipid II flippase